MLIPFCLLALSSGCAIATAGDIDVSIFAEIRLGKAPPPPPPEVIVVESGRHHGPPPWAPAHGRRAKQGYYYYPAGHVYFRPADRVWFYLEGDNWQVGASLPGHIHVDFNRSVSLEMDSDRPFLRHRDVVAFYPADYFAKVKIKHKDGPTGVIRAEIHADDHHPGRGNGKEKAKGNKK